MILCFWHQLYTDEDDDGEFVTDQEEEEGAQKGGQKAPEKSSKKARK